MRKLLMILLLGLTALVWANDGYMGGEGGQMHRVHGKHTTVRMVREWVDMDVFNDDYHVKVQFSFQNDGPATTVVMGFPESCGDGNGKIPAFRSFHSWVDGSKVKVIRQLVTRPRFYHEDGINAYWVKSVPFAAHQQRSVRVEYIADPGAHEGEEYPVYTFAGINFENNVGYDFTGGNWKGEVEESDLRVTFHLPGSNIVDSNLPLKQRANTFFHRWTHWQAEQYFSLTYYGTFPHPMLIHHAGEKRSFYLVSTRKKAPDPQVDPAIITKDGVDYVSLEQLQEFFRPCYGGTTTSDATIACDAKAREASFAYAGHILNMSANNPIMRVDGSRDVMLPAAPFWHQPFNGDDNSCNLYVPLRPIVQALGGKMTIDNRPLVVTISGHWKEGAHTSPQPPKFVARTDNAPANSLALLPLRYTPANSTGTTHRLANDRKRTYLEACGMVFVLLLAFVSGKRKLSKFPIRKGPCL